MAPATIPYRTIFLLCILKLFVFCIISIFYQFIAIHRIDEHSSNYLSPYNINSNTDKNNVVTSQSNSSTSHVIAYVVTLTGCGDNKRYKKEDAMNLITQGAAVLKHSIHLAHVNSKYDYQMYALIHPSANECSSSVSKLGYTTLIRNTPFDTDDIQTKFLREHVDGASCCGRKEYIKLYAYTLIQHPVAVVLDLDSLILQPLDDLFDALILERSDHSNNIPIHDDGVNTKKDIKNVEAFYTRDYNMVNPGGEKYAGVQGGFLMVKPSEQVFSEYVDIILEGDYREGRGWGGKYGYFFGGMQIQGICAYYYGEKHPEKGVELNRCRINSMVDSPYFKENEKKKAGECRDGRSTCEDCRTTDISSILSAHLTICQKPWECHQYWNDHAQTNCYQLHSNWFRIRRSFEESRTDNLKTLPDIEGSFQPELFHGYCTSPGHKGYLPIEI